MNDKRSDFPCPGIIRSGSGAQHRETQRISDTFAAELDRNTTPRAREQNRRNNEALAAKRRDMRKPLKMPT